MRMRRKKNLIPRLERCGDIIVKNPEERRGAWREGFDKLFLELGCGKGRFTAETAKNLTDTMLVAVERVPDAMVVAAERVVSEGLENVRFIDMDASRLLEVFSPGEAERIYINFCDPWPGKRHQKRRLTASGFLLLYRQALKDGGEIHFKTDNSELFEFSLEEFSACGFSLHQVTRDLHASGPVGVMTDYEQKFYTQGIKINRCVARKEEFTHEISGGTVGVEAGPLGNADTEI